MSAWKKLCRQHPLREKDRHAVLARRWMLAPRRRNSSKSLMITRADALPSPSPRAGSEVPSRPQDVQQVVAGEVALQLRGIGGLRASGASFVEDGLLVFLDDFDRTQRRWPSRAYQRRASRREHVHHLEVALDIFLAHRRGRITFTTTSSPLRSFATCTCAIDAAASGVSSNLLEDLGDGPAVRPVRRWRAPRLPGTGATRSWSFSSSSAMSGGSRSRRVEKRLAELHEDRGPRAPQTSRRARMRSAASSALAALEPRRGRQVEREAPQPAGTGCVARISRRAAWRTQPRAGSGERPMTRKNA